MSSGHDSIYFLPGDADESILKSPLLQKFKQRDVEVLLLTDPIDEFCMQHLSEYEKFRIKSIAKEDGGLSDSDLTMKKKQQKIKEMYKPLTDWWKQHLEKKVEKVAISNRLVEEPAFVFTSQYGYSAHMEKINRAQAFANQEKASSYMLAKKHFEINPSHPVMKELLERIRASGGAPDKETKSMMDLIFDTALLNSGFIIEDPVGLNTQVQKLVKLGLGIPKDAEVSDIEIDLDEDLEDAEETEQKIKDDYDEDIKYTDNDDDDEYEKEDL